FVLRASVDFSGLKDVDYARGQGGLGVGPKPARTGSVLSIHLGAPKRTKIMRRRRASDDLVSCATSGQTHAAELFRGPQQVSRRRAGGTIHVK
ncbi:MAG: hypothetical protein ACKOBM_08965, partial [Gammaproteobacteria bacterium]